MTPESFYAVGSKVISVFKYRLVVKLNTSSLCVTKDPKVEFCVVCKDGLDLKQRPTDSCCPELPPVNVRPVTSAPRRSPPIQARRYLSDIYIFVSNT